MRVGVDNPSSQLAAEAQAEAIACRPADPAVTRAAIYKLRHHVRGLTKGGTVTQRKEIAGELERLASDLRKPTAKAG